MISTSKLIGFTFAIALTAAPGTARAQLQPLATPARTIFLDGGTANLRVPSSVAYHPGFDQYYASPTGDPTVPGLVFGPTGGMPLQTRSPLNIDPRSWNFNPGTGLLEVVSFDAIAGGTARGLIEARVDATGMLTGETSTLLTSMPGNNGGQTSPAYDAVAEVFYSRDDDNVVNIVRRSNGALVGTILLDFTAAGIGSVLFDGIVFVPEPGWLGVLDDATDGVAFFDLSGKFVGTTALDITIDSVARRPGYANGQLFVFDRARNGYQGYRVVDIGCTTGADCDDDNACTDDTCNQNFQCVNANNTLPCSDGNTCSVNDACTQGSCVASVVGFEGLSCLLHRLTVPDLCPDGFPTPVRRFILKRLAKAKGLADRGESEGNVQFLAKARTLLDSIAAKADAAAASRSAGKRISTACAAAIRTRVQESTALLAGLP